MVEARESFGNESCGRRHWAPQGTNTHASAGSLGRPPLSIFSIALIMTNVFGAFVASWSGAGDAWANGLSVRAPPEMEYQMDDPTIVRQLVLPIDKSRILKIDRAFGELLIDNREIADVVPLTDTSIYIVGKKVGSTRLSVLDARKNLLGIIDLEVSYDLPGLRQSLSERLPYSGVTTTSVNGRVLLTGTVPDAVALETAVAIAQQYAPGAVQNALSVRASQQVLLEVRFIEVVRTAGRDLGVNWNTASASRYSGSTGMATGARRVTGEGPPLLAGAMLRSAIELLGFPSGAPAFGTIVATLATNGQRVDAIIQALEERGVVRRLAEPNLTALSGETATFLAGGEFPMPVPSGPEQLSIQMQPFGVSLAFTPTVLADGQIHIRLVPEVSEIDFDTGTTVLGTSVPGINVRRASTSVELRDGQTFAIAGLLQTDHRKEHSELPWIGRVPVLGALFRSASFRKRESDLVIIVTPRLVQPAVPGQKLATPLDNTLPGNDVDYFLMGKQEIDKKFPAPYGHILHEEDGWTAVVKRAPILEEGGFVTK